MAEENYLMMMTHFWESASKTAWDAQRNLMQSLATRMGTSFPMLFAPFLTGGAASTKASEALRYHLNSLMAVRDAMAKATGQTTTDAKTAEFRSIRRLGRWSRAPTNSGVCRQAG